MIERFRDPDRFVSMIVSLIEDSSLGIDETTLLVMPSEESSMRR